MEKISFHDQIARNRWKSLVLVIVVFIVLIALGYAISFAFSPEYFTIIMIIATIFSLCYVLISYYNSDKIALASVKAKKADPTRHRNLINAVENMAIASGMPKPQAYVMPGKQINAFASGRDPKHAVICVTEGALEKLNKQELEGVIGHEMSHVANYDIRFITTIAVVVGAISIFSQIFLRSLWFGGGSRKQGNAIFFLIAMAPIIVKLVQFAISRKREFMADAGSVKLTRYPPGMINCLEKIKADHEKLNVPGAVAPMFFSDTKKKKISRMFQTHPPIEARISALKKM
jgi:heat shock protein HtpX